MKRILLVLMMLMLLTAAVCADDLSDIHEAGVLRFGVSPDHFPFSFYDKNDELTGIDVKLMESVAELMGVSLEIVDVASEGLIESLQSGQTDVIGGAFSKTESRKLTLDFSRIYYSSGAVFVSRNSLKTAEPLTAESFSGMKIGVQKNTGFEEWLTVDFLEKGTITKKDIYTYQTVSDAMRALNQGKIDLVMMDANVFLSNYGDDPDYQSRQYGSAEDSFAFGLRKSSGKMIVRQAGTTADLKSELDRCLLQLLNDGTAQEIANRFFSYSYEEEHTLIRWVNSTATPAPAAIIIPISTAIPTAAIISSPTPYPTAVPTEIPTAVVTIPTTAACTYAMTYVADVTIPDGQQISANSYFTKTWRIKNTGTCAWTTDFTFGYASGSQMNGHGIYLPKTVVPGDTVDLSIDMIAPSAPGTYQGNWQLKTGQGYSIGPAIWVKITVPGAADATATPDTYYYNSPVQPTVIPEILWFYPNFYSQTSGNCVNVYWGLDKFSTAELTVDGTTVYFGSSSTDYMMICNEVYPVGVHQIRLCAYSAGANKCETLLYTTN